MEPVTLNYQEVGALSLDLLSLMEDNQVTRGVAMAAMMLTAARIAADKDQGIDKEIEIIKEGFNWLTLMTLEGEAN